VVHRAPLSDGLRPQPDNGPTRRPQHPDRHRGRLRGKAVWLLAAVVTGVGALLLPLGLGPRAAEGVLNGSAAVDLVGWRADSDAGPITLTRVPVAGGPSGVGTAVDIRRAAGRGRWAMALADLQRPQALFRVGKTYQMRAYVRDLNASGQSVGLLLANDNFLHRPTDRSRYERYGDNSWHLLTRTFVCTQPGAPDTALYFALPPSGALHWQVTAVSVREVPPVRSPTVAGGPTELLSFSGAAGAAPDPQVWSYELGGSGWGNKELQTYTSRASNAHVDGTGNLVITARREDATGPDGIARHYTSARITTKGKVEVQPGSYVEASIRAPVGAGVWPAFWLVGSNISEVGWPACGELDVFEGMGTKPSVAYSRIHMAAQSNPRKDAAYGGGFTGGDVDLGHPLDSRPHLYGVYFDYTMVRFYIDRKEHLAFGVEDALASDRTWPFGNPQYLVLNVAVGSFGGDPSATSFPRSMTVGAISIWEGGTPFDT
jgi:hypothetical protein